MGEHTPGPCGCEANEYLQITYCPTHAAAVETLERAENLGTALLAERARNADLLAERDDLKARLLRMEAEWFRHGLHDPGSMKAVELRQQVRSYRAAIAQAKGDA